MLLFVPILVVAGCAPVAVEAPVGPSGPVTITIVAMNDFHGALYEKPVPDMPDKALGGLPWLAGAVKQLRSEVQDLLLLDGGDSFQGDWPVNATKGAGSVEAFQLLGVDATAVGNHEFDYGTGGPGSHPLRGALMEAARTRTQWLAANIKQTETGQPWLPDGIRPWALFERKGVRIAVIGLSTTDTPTTTLTKNVADLAFSDPVETVRGLLPEIEAAGAQVVVVIGHLTGECNPALPFVPDPSCEPDGEIGRLVTELPSGTIDVLVAGHAHTLFANRIGDTFVLENRSQGQALGRVDLVVGPNGVDPNASKLYPPWPLLHDRVAPGCSGAPYPLEPRDLGGRTIVPDGAALTLVHDLETRAGGSLCEKVGCTSSFLGRSRTGESAVGDLVADAMLAAFPGAEVALQNSGGLRADLPSGELRKEHIFGVMPFDNRLVSLDLTGEQLLYTLRLGSAGAHGILQVSGVRYRFDSALQSGTDLDGDGTVADWERDRLCWAEDSLGAIDPKKKYRVVTTDFLVGGGDHLGPAFAGIPVEQEGPLVREAILSYVRGRETCLGSSAPVLDLAHPRVEIGPCP